MLCFNFSTVRKQEWERTKAKSLFAFEWGVISKIKLDPECDILAAVIVLCLLNPWI